MASRQRGRKACRAGRECDSASNCPRSRLASRESFQAELAKAGYDRITTEIADVPPFYYAEDYHQQYLEKNPEGYCGLGGIGVCLPPSLNR